MYYDFYMKTKVAFCRASDDSFSMKNSGINNHPGSRVPLLEVWWHLIDLALGHPHW